MVPMHTTADLPPAVPVLSRGKHRSPRKGGCFMEFASFLAGEPWSDQPKCTHPLLASLARDVNDQLSDEARLRIAPLIPDVIGLVGDDPYLDLTIAVQAGAAALPVAAFERQKSLAVALFRCERELGLHPACETRELRELIQSALSSTPGAAQWARGFTEQSGGKVQDFPRTAQHIVHLAVSGIAKAATSDADDRLVELLETCVQDVREHLGRTDTSAATTAPVAAGTHPHVSQVAMAEFRLQRS